MKQEKLTVQQFRELAEKQKADKAKRRNKYNAKRCHGYHSEKEYYRAQDLKLMLRSGLISDLREQVSFLLIPSQINSEGIEETAVHYRADFVYRDNASGRTVVEDTKGYRTEDYKIKRKLMLLVHGITIKET